MTNRPLGAMALGMLLLAGCAGDDPPSITVNPSAEPVSLQILRASPELRSQHFSNMLNFEMPSDAVFVQTADLKSGIDSSRAHTGHSSLRVEGGRGQFTIRLSSLMGSRPFPGDWTLAGAYFLSDRPAQVTVTAKAGKKSIAQEKTTLLPQQWTPVLVDLVTQSISAEGDPSLVFTVDSPDVVWCDDVILIDNTQWIFGDPQTTSAGGWTLCRRGNYFISDMPGRFTVHLLTSEARPEGWTLQESNSLRMRFSSTGPEKSMTIWSDGRSYLDGHYRALSGELRTEPLWEQQESSPAEVEIPQEMGRLERRSPGDENNDGYNESRGTYMIAATGPRLDITLAPRSVPLMRPTFEITGLPPGKVLATIEGRLIEQTVRLNDGTLLVQIPAKIDRPVTVNVRVQ